MPCMWGWSDWRDQVIWWRYQECQGWMTTKVVVVVVVIKMRWQWWYKLKISCCVICYLEILKISFIARSTDKNKRNEQICPSNFFCLSPLGLPTKLNFINNIEYSLLHVLPSTRQSSVFHLLHQYHTEQDTQTNFSSQHQ